MSETTNYEKIMALLKNRSAANMQLGLQLLISSEDPELISQVIANKSYIGGMVCWPLIPLFQSNPSLWEAVSLHIPDHRKRNIEIWLNYKILTFENATQNKFCHLATQEVRKIYPEFPELDMSIITEVNGYYHAQVQEGKKLTNDIGWSLFIESRDIGPAEVIHEEEWIATAHHPNGNIKVNYNESGGMIPRCWLEELNKIKKKK